MHIMRKLMRTLLVACLVAMLSFSPAVACNYCGGYGGGGYYTSGGYYGSGYGGGYYGGGYSTGCCGGGYSSGYYESSSCCGGEVVVSEGCGDCGTSDCGGCDGGCDGCSGGCEGGCTGCDGGMVTEENVEPPMAAPEAPVHEEAPLPSTVNRVPTEPAPALPPNELPATDTEAHAMPPVEPATETPLPAAEDRYDTTTPPVDTAPPVESMPPVEATPPVTEPVTPPAESADDLFSTPSTDSAPLPVEEPATPSEAADDLFSEPATPPATDPATEPATTPTTEPSGDDLFGPPAEETPAEETTPPAEESTEETDDLFGKAQSILETPGGLSSDSLRQWADNTGTFSCKGRMLRMMDGKVQLLKDNGRTTTVPLARLSQGDLEFVNRQASAQKAETLGKTAQVSNAW
jgi:hypothetical protein